MEEDLGGTYELGFNVLHCALELFRALLGVSVCGEVDRRNDKRRSETGRT